MPRRWCDRLVGVLDRLRDPSQRQRRWIAVGVFVISVSYILLTSALQGRDFVPKFHDEFMHLLQMRMLAQGRLWLAEHPLADFFETFHVLVKPVYASIYWPGTALLYLPVVWLHLPCWIGPLLVAGFSAALFYRIVTELIDGVAGLLGVLLLLSLGTFRFLALVVISHGVIIALGLAIVWTYLSWRANPRRYGHAAILGALIGWAAITRPIDAIAFALPVGVAVIMDLRKLALPSRAIAFNLLAIALAAMPFLALQFIENVGVTGHLFRSPYQVYAEQDSPSLKMGFGPVDPQARPKSSLPQKQLFYEIFLLPEIEKHTLGNIPATWWHDRIPLLIRVTLPSAILLPLLALSVLNLRQNRRWVLWAMWPIFCLLYVFFPFLLRHYAVVAAPAILLGVLLGKDWIEARWPNARVRVTLTLAVALLAIVALPEIDRDVIDDYARPTMVFAAKDLPRLVNPPAIVLFRFARGANFHEEPVYNIDSANPDDAPIIRAHDLGVERDRELFDYYARRQPQRTVYLFDRSTRQLVELGKVADLARRFPLTTKPAS